MSRHESAGWGEHDRHGAHLGIHRYVHAVGINNGEVELGWGLIFGLLGQLGLKRAHGFQLRCTAHGSDHLGRQRLAFGIGGDGCGRGHASRGTRSGRRGLSRRWRNRDVDVAYRTQCGNGFVELLGIADHQHCQLILVEILCGDAIDVRHGGLLNSGTIFLKKVQRVAIELVRHALAQNFVRRIEIENEGIEDGILGALDFVFCNGLLLQFVEIVVERLNRFHRAFALGAQHETADAGMIESGANAAADGVGQSQPGTNVLDQAGRETAAHHFVEHFNGEVVGIVAIGARRNHAHVRLVDIFFCRQVVARLRRMDFDFCLGRRRTFWQRAESGF